MIPNKFTEATLHSPDLTDYGFGWKRSSIPSIQSFKKLVQKSTLSEFSDEIIAAFDLFQFMLSHSFSRDELKKLSPIFSLFDPDIRRDDLRFFFNLAFTQDGMILVTAFLEATPEEVQNKGICYRNANKHLHHVFLGPNQIIQKSKLAFKRDEQIARHSEHTAFMQVYLRPHNTNGVRDGVSMLVHPIQKASLLYDYKLHPEYKLFQQDLNLLIKAIGRTKLKLLKEGNDLKAQEIDHLQGLLMKIPNQFESDLKKLKNHEHNASTHDKSMPDLILEIKSFLVKLDGSNLERIQLTKKSPAYSIHSSIKSILRRTQEYFNARMKGVFETEEVYRSADTFSGIEREYALIAVADILAGALERCLPFPARQFYLSSKQIDTKRLTREDGGIREKIKIVSTALEAYYPTTQDTYPLRIVNPDGSVGEIDNSNIIEFVQIPYALMNLQHLPSDLLNDKTFPFGTAEH